MENNKLPRTFELRVYTLPSQKALDFYKDEIYPRHLKSFPIFGIEPHGFWTSPNESGNHKLYVLASYPGDQNPEEVARKYMASKEFFDDIQGFDPQTITSVDTTYLQSTASSPLK